MRQALPLPEPGTLLVGKYVLGEVLGRGAMGAVYRATHKELGTRFAVKVLADFAGTAASAKARFLNEARLTSQLTSAHAVRTFDVDLWNGVPFIVMEYLDGRDLAKTLKERGPLRLKDATDAIVEACHALHEAHGRGIVHRDVKPANLFLSKASDGHKSIKVLDFGISKGPMVGLRLTSPLSFLGSPAYAAPEQIESSSTVDARADVWSLGATFFELLAGRRAFQATGIADAITTVMGGRIPDAEDHIKGCPPVVADAIRGCLQRDVDARIKSASALALKIAPFGSTRSQLIATRLDESRASVTITAARPPMSEAPPPTANEGMARAASDEDRPSAPAALSSAPGLLPSTPARMDAPTSPGAMLPVPTPAAPFVSPSNRASGLPPVAASGTFDGVVTSGGRPALGVALGLAAAAVLVGIATVSFMLTRDRTAPAAAGQRTETTATAATTGMPSIAPPTTAATAASAAPSPDPTTAAPVTAEPPSANAGATAPAPTGDRRAPRTIKPASSKPKSGRGLAQDPESW